ncbi:TetR/AcrR family transcriptional regulator [Rossellomorea marisflavi]|uniref:TetR/AcrR family transcriptional regulator n=1 Tax=Rossellomorea marisflavi TaxID=189381 RepID=UPI003FA15047
MPKQPTQVSEETILKASWSLLEEGGIEKFSMRKLAVRLGIQAPSLYWYFKSKQDLYQRLVNQISKKIVEEYDEDGDWKSQLTELATTVRRVLGQYPCSTQLMMMTLPHEPDMIRFTNLMLRCVESTPLQEEQKLQVVMTLMNYVFYFVLDGEQHERNVSTIVKEHGGDPGEEVTNLLESMSEGDAGLFRRLFKNGMFDLMGTDSAFEFGLRVIVMGIEQVMKENE